MYMCRYCQIDDMYINFCVSTLYNVGKVCALCIYCMPDSVCVALFLVSLCMYQVL